MADRSDTPGACEAYREQLVEVALGILDGRERAEVLRHAQSCTACGPELAALSVVGDNLVQLAPEAEPPLGFENRLAERLTRVREPKPTRLRARATRAILAAAAMIAIGFGIGAATMHAQSPAKSAPAVALAASLTSHGTSVGEVMISPGKPAWVSMSIKGQWIDGWVTCALTLSNGKTVVVGRFDVGRGYGSWGASVSLGGSAVTSASVRATSGALLARAHFAA